MVKYSSAMAAANLLALAQALPAQPVCNVIVQIVTGTGYWVPQPDPTWSVWDPASSTKTKTPEAKTTTSVVWSEWSDPASSTKTKTPVAKTTTSVVWSDWSDPSASTKTSSSAVAETWTVWTTSTSSASVAKTTTSTTTKKGGEFFPSTTITTSAYEYTTTSEAAVPTTTSSSSTTTSAAPKATATCPAYDQTYTKKEGISGGGSCDSTYTINCGARVNVPQDGSVKFWERNSGELIGSLAECVAICDENSACNAVIWTDWSGASSYDLNHCWQTDNLPQPSTFGGEGQYGQISYKGAISGECASTYVNA